MTVVIDWDVKPQIKQKYSYLLRFSFSLFKVEPKDYSLFKYQVLDYK